MWWCASVLRGFSAVGVGEVGWKVLAEMGNIHATASDAAAAARNSERGKKE